MAVAFLVINLTNDTILHFIERHYHLYGTDSSVAVNEAKTILFFLVPAKALMFSVCVVMLGLKLGPAVKRMTALVNARAVVQTVVAFAIGLMLTATIFPVGFGRSYARISTDPFNQVPDQIYRRLLLPGLAYVFHLNGFLYVVPVWAVLFAAALAMKAYFFSKSHRLSLLEEVSLLTVGVFITSFQVPGNPEAAVFLLAVIAWMDFERTGQCGGVQLAALSLALMAHETCAFIVFTPMILFMFPRRAWVPSLTVGLAYGLALAANFSFHLATPIRMQSEVSSTPASVYFLRSPALDLTAVFFSFKMLWILIPVGIYFLCRKRPRVALYCAAGLTLAIAAMYIAVDYTRIIGFSTLAMVMCYEEAAKHLRPRVLKSLLAVNILIPTIFVAGGAGLTTGFPGLYRYGSVWIAAHIGLGK